MEVLGSMIAILLVAGLVFVCAREIWGKKAGGCGGGCAGCSGGCHGCSKCSPEEQAEMRAKYEQAWKRAEEIKKGLEIKPTKGIPHGFRLAAKDGSGYFDCSDDAIMEMLMPYFRNLDFQ